MPSVHMQSRWILIIVANFPFAFILPGSSVCPLPRNRFPHLLSFYPARAFAPCPGIDSPACMTQTVYGTVWSDRILCAAPPQACTNTILAHFASIVFANWLQKILLKPGKAGSSGIQKPDFPDYTQKRGGPTGAMS